MRLPQFTIMLEGSDKDKGKLRLEEFIQSLSVIVEALKETERRLGGYSKSKIQYKIIRLNLNGLNENDYRTDKWNF